MPATATPLRPVQDPASTAALAELVQLGMTVARAAARLADIENTALDTLADATTATTHALAIPPASLGDALRAGRNADATEAARDAATARIALITECFSKAARAVRRTVALQARLAAGRPFPEIPPATPPSAPHVTPQSPAPRPRPASRAEPADADGPDRPENGDETGDELGAATDEATLHTIHRDLAGAATNVTRLPQPARVPINPPPPTAAPPPLPPEKPGPVPTPPPDT